MGRPGAADPAFFRRASGAAARLAWAALFALAPAAARALGPHEVALLVNAESRDSVVLGEAWARLRGVPAANVVRLSLPCGTNGAPPAAISREDFVSRIWEPANGRLAEAGVAPHVLAWVYSCGFPARVAQDAATVERTDPNDLSWTNDLSLAGATFLRARWPADAGADVAGAGYVSPLFAGPDGGGRAVRPAETFDRARNVLLDSMPLPAAMLAWTGGRGLPLEEALAALERSAAADSTFPEGTVHFRLRPGDPRSDAREWEVAAAAAALEACGLRAVVSTNAPSAEEGPLLGYLDGARAVSPLPALAPGAFADHFTSYAGAFDQPTQMKATAWLGAGAAFTAGTVAEPFARWEKFPAAQLFVRRREGLCALEALCASVRNPLQLLPLGDPLSAPWTPCLVPAIAGLPPGGAAAGPLVLRAVLPPPDDPAAGVRHDWFVDGRAAGRGPTFVWNVPALSPGKHEVRLVVRVLPAHGVRLQGTAVAFVERAAEEEEEQP